MKVIYVWLACLVVAQTLNAASAGTYVPVAVNELFVPRGFDDNDDVVVSLTGNFPTACYQIAHAELKTEGTGRILIQQMAYMVPGPCARVLVPFSNTVHLGRVRAGNYYIRTQGAPYQGQLSVGRARVPTQDDYLYAPVLTASVIPSGNQRVAYLEGRLTNSCLKVRAVEATYSGNTIQVLPILELLPKQPDGGACREINQPLRLTKTLQALKRGTYLLHVRSLNGQSLNVVFSVDN